MRTFKDVLPDFLADREVAIAKSTYSGYAYKFSVISTWLEENNLADAPLSSIDDRVISRLFNHLALERGLDRTTCMNYKVALGVFFDFAHRWGYCDKPSFGLVTLPEKKEDKGASVIPQADLKKLLEPIREQKKQLHLVMMTEYYCALRPGTEIRLMKISEVDLDAGVIRISPTRAKNRRKVVVTMPEQLIALYRAYIGDTSEDFFVFGKGGKPGIVPWSRNTLRNQFNRYRDNLNLPKSYKLYSNKHTGITRLAESGTPLHIIMSHARHSNLSTTQRYIHRYGGLVDDAIRYNFPNP